MSSRWDEGCSPYGSAMVMRRVAAVAVRPVGAMALHPIAVINHDSPAPKGHSVKARGVASGTVPNTFPSPERAASLSFGSAPSGRGIIMPMETRALPWAIACRPVGTRGVRPMVALAVRALRRWLCARLVRWLCVALQRWLYVRLVRWLCIPLRR
jgi:hypothetical protein